MAPSVFVLPPITPALAAHAPTFSPGIAKQKPELIRQRLISMLSNAQEGCTVRESAWRSLSQYRLRNHDLSLCHVLGNGYERVREAKMDQAQ